MSNTPGCYGSPLCCRPKQSPCTACPLMRSCETDAKTRAERLRDKYGIDVALSQKTVRKPASVSDGSNKKAVELIGSIKRKGIDLRQALSEGNNPFAARPPAYMRIAVDQLLDGGIERPVLKTRFMGELGWTDASASSHVGIAAGALLGLGAAQLQGERLVLA